jgi:hypothetical protein
MTINTVHVLGNECNGAQVHDLSGKPGDGCPEFGWQASGLAIASGPGRAYRGRTRRFIYSGVAVVGIGFSSLGLAAPATAAPDDPACPPGWSSPDGQCLYSPLNPAVNPPNPLAPGGVIEPPSVIPLDGPDRRSEPFRKYRATVDRSLVEDAILFREGAAELEGVERRLEDINEYEERLPYETKLRSATSADK